MTKRIVRLAAGDYDEAMDFLNLVFTADLAALLPAIYQPTGRHMGWNFAIRQDRRIRAIVGCFPMTWHVGNAALKVGYIGGVSTHPRYRGRGLMKALMGRCVHHMREQRFHLSWLGGQRQRYRHYGYERCGPALQFTLHKMNLGAIAGPVRKLRFEPLGAEQRARLALARRWHDAQPIRCERPAAHFHRFLTNWHNRPWAALDRTGRMVGYLVANKAGDSIAEIGAPAPGTAVEVLRAWLLGREKDSINIECSPLPDGLTQRLGQFCESYQVRPSGNVRVLDWVAALDALLKVRQAAAPLAPGSVVLGIHGYGRVRLDVTECGAAATLTRAAAHLEADGPEMARLLFGPLRPSQVRHLPAPAAALEPWCPLPARWPPQDGA